jgi:hypothetical protein
MRNGEEGHAPFLPIQHHNAKPRSVVVLNPISQAVITHSLSFPNSLGYTIVAERHVDNDV